MEHRALVLALLMAATPLAHGQTPDKQAPAAAAKPAGGGVEQILTKIENDTLVALLKKDAAAFGKFFADDAVLGTPDGAQLTKTQLLADVKSGALTLESSTISDMKVRVYGDAAVATYMTTDKGKYKGQDISGKYRWTDTFVRRGGTWLIVAGQGTPIQPPPPPK
jgi:ketosteroid isomerase-like protein